jgi:hypothetical protein
VKKTTKQADDTARAVARCVREIKKGLLIKLILSGESPEHIQAAAAAMEKQSQGGK